MKDLFFVLLLLSSNIILAQTEIIHLNKGNTWFYDVETKGELGSKLVKEVVGDTLMYFPTLYKKIGDTSFNSYNSNCGYNAFLNWKKIKVTSYDTITYRKKISWEYFYVDTARLIYRPEHSVVGLPLMDLSLNSDTTLKTDPSFTWCSEVSLPWKLYKQSEIKNIFNAVVNVYKSGCESLYSQECFEITKEFGIISDRLEWVVMAPGLSDEEKNRKKLFSLKGAFIDGVHYGQIIFPDLAPDPVNLTVRQDTTSVLVKWNKSPESDVKEYKLFVNDKYFCATKETYITVSNLTVDKKYAFKVCVVDSNNHSSSFSNEVTIYPYIPSIYQKVSMKLDILPEPSRNAISICDVNNDGFMDFVVAGPKQIFENSGNGTFKRYDMDANYIVGNADIKPGDFNSDGYIDFVSTGWRSSDGSLSQLLTNNEGVKLQSTFKFSWFDLANIACGDINNDGFLDFAVSCDQLSSWNREELDVYINNKNGNFTRMYVSDKGSRDGTLTMFDMNQDGKLDIVQGARDGVYIYYSHDAKFEKQLLTPEHNCKAIVADFNKDGYADILNSSLTKACLFRGSEVGFSRNIDTLDEKLVNTNVIAVDMNNDGYKDLVAVGKGQIYLFVNNEGKFKYIPSAFERHDSLYLSGNCNIEVGDFDNDGNMDVVLTDINGNCRFYFNSLLNKNTYNPNSVPKPPRNLSEQYTNKQIKFIWDNGWDSETPQCALNYNIRLSKKPYGIDIISPMSNINTGKLDVVAYGNTMGNNFYLLKGLIPGKYYWSVQTIDNQFSASKFAEEKELIVGEDGLIAKRESAKIYTINCFPNPCYNRTTLKLEVYYTRKIIIKLFDILGREVWSETRNDIVDGINNIDVNMINYTSGIYICKIETGSDSKTIKLILCK